MQAWGKTLTPCVWLLFHPIPPKLLIEKDTPSTQPWVLSPRSKLLPQWKSPLCCVHNSYGAARHNSCQPPPGSGPRALQKHHSYPRRDSSSWAEASCMFWASAVRGSFFWKAKTRWVFICCFTASLTGLLQVTQSSPAHQETCQSYPCRSVCGCPWTKLIQVPGIQGVFSTWSVPPTWGMSSTWGVLSTRGVPPHGVCSPGAQQLLLLLMLILINRVHRDWVSLTWNLGPTCVLSFRLWNMGTAFTGWTFLTWRSKMWNGPKSVLKKILISEHFGLQIFF